MYDVLFHSYCGMTTPLARGADRERVKAIVRAKLRRAKRFGQPVSRCGRLQWEFSSPDDAFMVSDSDGILSVRRARRSARNDY